MPADYSIIRNYLTSVREDGVISTYVKLIHKRDNTEKNKLYSRVTVNAVAVSRHKSLSKLQHVLDLRSGN